MKEVLGQAWIAARDAKDYSQFAPVLEEWVALTNEACALIDPSRPAYDVRRPVPATTLNHFTRLATM